MRRFAVAIALLLILSIQVHAVQAVASFQLTKLWSIKGDYFHKPVVGDKLLYSTTRDYVVAIDKQSGRKMWSYSPSPEFGMTSELALIGSNLYDYQGNKLYSLNPSTGKQQWKYTVHTDPTVDDYITTAPIGYYNLIVLTTFSGEVFALDEKTGKVKWTYSDDDRSRAPHLLALSNPVPRQDKVYFFSDVLNRFYAIDAKTGKLSWKLDLEKDFNNSDGGQLFVYNGYAFIVTNEGKVVSVDLSTKKVRYAKNTFLYTKVPAVQQDAWLFALGEDEHRIFGLSLKDSSLRTYSYQKGIVDFSVDSGSITVLLPNEFRVINRWNGKEQRFSINAAQVQTVGNFYYFITDEGLQKMQIK